MAQKNSNPSAKAGVIPGQHNFLPTTATAVCGVQVPASNPNFLWRRESSKETSTPSKASPIYGEDATRKIAARRRFSSILVSRDTAYIFYRLAH